jgi:hypothetical protein
MYSAQCTLYKCMAESFSTVLSVDNGHVLVRVYNVLHACVDHASATYINYNMYTHISCMFWLCALASIDWGTSLKTYLCILFYPVPYAHLRKKNYFPIVAIM